MFYLMTSDPNKIFKIRFVAIEQYWYATHVQKISRDSENKCSFRRARCEYNCQLERIQKQGQVGHCIDDCLQERKK